MTNVEIANARLGLAVDQLRVALLPPDSPAQTLMSANVAARAAEVLFWQLWQRVSGS